MPKISLSMLALALIAGALARPATAARPMVVAVLYFDNNTGDATYDVLQKGLADMLVTDLSSVSALQVVEREKLEKLLDELRLQRTGYFDPKTAQTLGRGIGAEYAITGAFAAIDPELRIDIRLVEVATARVIMADKVIGKKNALFELEGALVSKFVRGLKLRAQVAPAGGARDVATLLEYSQGVDSADKGDLETASQKLGAVVQRVPSFTLAKTKYADVIKRLHLAKKRRERDLGTEEQVLLRNINAMLAKNPATLGDSEVTQYFGYRVALGQYHLWQIRKLAGLQLREWGPRWIAAKDQALLEKLQKQFFANSESFIAELRAQHSRAVAQSKRPSVSMAVSPEDTQRGTELGIAPKISEWSFASPRSVALALAKFTVLGIAPFWLESGNFEVRPSLAERDPAYGKKALALLASARAELEKDPKSETLQDDMADVVDLQAEVLLFLGRREEAIAQWQGYLDRFPKATAYEGFEAKIESLLGISKEAQAFQTALATCSQDLFGVIHQEADRLGRAEGSAGLRRLISDLDRACKQSPLALSVSLQAHYQAARVAVTLGDCGLYRELEAKARKLDPTHAGSITQIPSACK